MQARHLPSWGRQPQHLGELEPGAGALRGLLLHLGQGSAGARL